MRILMLGWEFPPFIAGGLGTACYGLTKALDRLGHEVVFILPKPVDQSQSSHIRLLSPEAIRALPPDAPVLRSGAAATAIIGAPGSTAAAGQFVGADSYTMPGFANTTFHALPASFSSPYPEFSPNAGVGGAAAGLAATARPGAPAIGTDGLPLLGPDGEQLVWPEGVDPQVIMGAANGSSGAGAGYEGDMVDNAERYARLVVALGRHERFDVIHAHDWMTFPAGLWIARATGKPLVVHVHSTEFDRAGDHPNQRVYDIERRGMHGAMRVVAVSELTKSLCTKRYGVDPAKVGVVYNGIDNESAAATQSAERIEARDKIVLFLGRITMQKGPEYFVRAAKRVLEKVPNTKFIMAGSGDMYTRSIEEAAALGIGHRFSFTGFLRGKQVDEVFRMADCYVMPSVSEPFGIAPLEAMRNDTPVIISKQSGVSEVLTHALKVDFWDIDDMANKVVAVLRHPPLSQTLREHGSFELRKLTWDGAAAKCVQAYGAAIATMETTTVGAGRKY